MWVSRIATVAAFVILSRQLDPKDFGLIALAMAVIGVLSLFGDSGVNTYVQRARTTDQVLLSTAFWTTMALAVGLAVALALIAVPVADIFDEPALVPVLRWLSVGLVLNGLVSIPTAVLKRSMRFRTLAVRGTVATLFGSLVAVSLALAGYGVWALVVQSLVRSAVAVVITWTAARWLPGLVWSRGRTREMMGFGGKILVIGVLNTVQDRGQDFLIGGISGTPVLGLWSVANRLVRIIQEVGASAVSAVATPAFATMQSEPKRLFRAYEHALVTTGAIMFPALLLLSVTSPDLVPTLLGEQWRPTAQAAQVVALTAAIGVFSYFDRTVLIALDRLRQEIVLVAVGVVIQLTLVVVLAPVGLLPLALGLLGNALLTLPVRLLLLRRVAGVPLAMVLRPVRVALAAVLMGLTVVLVLATMPDANPWVRIGAAFGTALAVYPMVLFVCARSVVRQLIADAGRLRSRRRPLEDEAPSERPVTVSVGAGQAGDR
jgi:O-antigen/teichoic acid export membrane protein